MASPEHGLPMARDPERPAATLDAILPQRPGTARFTDRCASGHQRANDLSDLLIIQLGPIALQSFISPYRSGLGEPGPATASGDVANGPLSYVELQRDDPLGVTGFQQASDFVDLGFGQLGS